MVSEIVRVDDGEVEAHRNAGGSGNPGVPSDPPVASSQNSLRPAKSLPSVLPSDNQVLVARQTAPKPAHAFLVSMKRFINTLTLRNVPRSVPVGETDQHGDSPADNANKEETFRWTSHRVDPKKVYGFDEEQQALESFVRRENNQGFRAVAVVGSGGIGKTTLCQLLFNEKGIKEDFAPRIWVSNSRQPTEDTDLKKAIVRRMLMQIGEDETDDMELDQLMALLHKNLWGKKYLIVLDDVHDADEWYDNLGAVPNMEKGWKDRLAYGLPKGSGGRIVVTGRNEEVARKMVGELNLHKVVPLSTPDYCWSIFEESVGPVTDEATKNKMNALKREVYEKSAGIPLAVKIMGQIMKEQLREESQERIDRTSTA